MDAESHASAAESPTWRTPAEAFGVIAHRPHLTKTLTIAVLVGTVLFVINQLDVVLRGDATTTVWIKSAITYLVPFVVSNLGVLVASRRPDDRGGGSIRADAPLNRRSPSTSARPPAASP